LEKKGVRVAEMKFLSVKYNQFQNEKKIIKEKKMRTRMKIAHLA
jgi:hypothetical protein